MSMAGFQNHCIARPESEPINVLKLFKDFERVLKVRKFCIEREDFDVVRSRGKGDE